MDNLWKFIDDRKLDLDISRVSDHVLCGICNGLMRNASFTKCGCRFCAKCIGDYLSSGGGHLCPGCLKEGTNTDLSEDCEVVVDLAGNRDVANLRLKCPHAGCSESVEMKAMLAHLLVCEYGTAQSCLFDVVGCNKEIEAELRRQMEKMRDTMVEMKAEAERITIEMKKKDEQIQSLREEMKKLKAGQRNEAPFLEDGGDMREWRIANKDEYKDRGERYGDVFNLGGYSIGFLVDIFLRGGLTHVHANLVLHPSCNDAVLEWPLRREFWIQFLDPSTNVVIAEKKFGQRQNTDWKEDYNKPSSRIILTDSDINIRPGLSISNWDCKSLSAMWNGTTGSSVTLPNSFATSTIND